MLWGTRANNCTFNDDYIIYVAFNDTSIIRNDNLPIINILACKNTRTHLIVTRRGTSSRTTTDEPPAWSCLVVCSCSDLVHGSPRCCCCTTPPRRRRRPLSHAHPLLKNYYGRRHRLLSRTGQGQCFFFYKGGKWGGFKFFERIFGLIRWIIFFSN